MANACAVPNMNGHAGHGHSHSKKSAVQRLPLQPTSVNGSLNGLINGGPAMNGRPGAMSLLKPHEHSHHQSQKSTEMFHETHQRQQQPPSHLQLPTPPSFSTPTSARSKSMERRKSGGLPTHLSLPGSGYGFPSSSSQRFQAAEVEGGRKWLTARELVNSILVPLPFVLASLAAGLGVVPNPNTVLQPPTEIVKTDKLINSILEDTPSINARTLTPVPQWILVCGLTSMTLILIGMMGKFNQALGRLGRRHESYIKSEELGKRSWLLLTRGVAARVSTVGLPFYATAKLGGARVSTIMLAALASDLIAVDVKVTDLTTIKAWKQLLKHRKWTVGSIILQLACDLAGMTSHLTAFDICLGYLALGLSVFALPPPYPSSRPKTSIVTSPTPTSASFGTPWETPPDLQRKSALAPTKSPMICTPTNVDLTIWSGALLGVFSIMMLFMTKSSASATSRMQPVWSLLSACAGASALTITVPTDLRNNRGLGFTIGAFLSCLSLMQLHTDPWSPFAFQSILVAVAFAAMIYDTHIAISATPHSNHHHHHHGNSQIADTAQMSRFSQNLLYRSQDWPLLYSIISEKDSRRIFYFMWCVIISHYSHEYLTNIACSLNFSFMLVQTFYGIATGSLGLLSDSIHMFFDCLALVFGLCASVMSKWPPSTRFPFGYAKIETLAGFANGIFLMYVPRNP